MWSKITSKKGYVIISWGSYLRYVLICVDFHDAYLLSFKYMYYLTRWYYFNYYSSLNLAIPNVSYSPLTPLIIRGKYYWESLLPGTLYCRWHTDRHTFIESTFNTHFNAIRYSWQVLSVCMCMCDVVCACCKCRVCVPECVSVSVSFLFSII